MRTLLLSLVFFSPIVAADEANDDDFGFIEEGERNRAKVEADRAPNANIFLEEEDEDTEMWTAPAEDIASVQTEINDVEGFDPTPPAPFAFEGDDPAEDMEGLGPDMSGRSPLGDHFPLTVSPSTMGGLSAELPVLVARTSDDLQGDLWVVADIYADGTKVGESRHFVSPQSVSEMSPTYVWIKATVPTSGPAGEVEVRIFAAPPGKKETPLFTRRAAYRL
jgi:hypothetical protein